MGKMKSIMMDVEDFVYDFYTADGEMLESPKVIIEKAIEEFGWSFGSYASEIIEEADEADRIRARAVLDSIGTD